MIDELLMGLLGPDRYNHVIDHARNMYSTLIYTGHSPESAADIVVEAMTNGNDSDI